MYSHATIEAGIAVAMVLGIHIRIVLDRLSASHNPGACEPEPRPTPPRPR